MNQILGPVLSIGYVYFKDRYRITNQKIYLVFLLKTSFLMHFCLSNIQPTEISQNQVQQEFYCEANERACCYDSVSTLNNVVRESRCITRSRPSSNPSPFWRQQCSSSEPRNIRQGEKRCGERRFREISGKKQGQANPSEFPWGCLVLDQSNNFVGSCAIIPDNRFNDVRSGTDRVVTAAHKLKNHRNT